MVFLLGLALFALAFDPLPVADLPAEALARDAGKMIGSLESEADNPTELHPHSYGLGYQCGRFVTCGAACAEVLGEVEESRLARAVERGEVCPVFKEDAARVAAAYAAGTSTDVALAALRAHAERGSSMRVAALGPRLRSLVGPADRDRLDCALARLGLAGAAPDACRRAGAQLMLRVSNGLAEVSPTDLPQVLAKGCSELPACGGATPCRAALDAAAVADPSQRPTIFAAAAPTCPAIAAALKAGADTVGSQLWTAYALTVRADLKPDDQRALDCALARLSLIPPVAACPPPLPPPRIKPPAGLLKVRTPR